MHHEPGIFNGIWSDMAIETTYMHYHHENSQNNWPYHETKGFEDTVPWASMLPIQSYLIWILSQMIKPNTKNSHKEEPIARIKNRCLWQKCSEGKHLFDILDPEQHPADGLVNIVTGKVITDPKVNVDQAITTATSDMKEFEAGLLASCHAPGYSDKCPNNDKGI
jgi:hypothetical protein